MTDVGDFNPDLDLNGNPVPAGTSENGTATTLLGVVNPPTEPKRVQTLKEAAQLITGDRQQDYGPPSVNFQRIADLWNVQLAHRLKDGEKFTPVDVALALTQLKMARAVQSPKHDTFVDGAGYLAIADELAEDLNG